MNESLGHIEQVLGSQRALSLEWLVPLTLVYVLIFILGVVGNVATILVICKFRYMQTLTNLYLCNLAITDLLTLTAGMPLELYTLWHQYPWQLGPTVCHLKSLIPETTAYASILTLVTFTLERYLAICGTNKNPASSASLNASESHRLKKVAIRNILIIWLLSFLGASPLALFTQINYLYANDEAKTPLLESAWCGLPFNAPDRLWESIIFGSTVIFFVIPLLIISILYACIVRTLKLATRTLEPFNNPDMQLTDQRSTRKIMQSRKIVVRLLVAVVLAFALSWSPFHAQRLLFLYVSLYAQWTTQLRQVNQILFLTAGVFYYLNSMVNPILYSVMSTRFRTAFGLYVADCCGSSSSRSASSSAASRHHARPSNSDQSREKRVLGDGGSSASGSATHGIIIAAKVHWCKNPNYFEA